MSKSTQAMLPRSVCTLVSFFSFVFFATGCVGPTPYQSAELGNGYAGQQIGDNKQVVSFSGNALTSKEAVANGLLLRAAEVTLEKGYDYFIIEDQVVEKSTTNIKLPQRGVGGIEAFPGLGLPPTGAVDSYYPMEAHKITATISLHRGEAPADNSQAYDARKIKPLPTGNSIITPPPDNQTRTYSW